VADRWNPFAGNANYQACGITSELRVTRSEYLSAQTAQSSQQAPIRLAAHSIEPVEAPAAVETTLEELKRLGPTLGSEIGIDQLLDDH
jgi:hypothetical protein